MNYAVILPFVSLFLGMFSPIERTEHAAPIDQADVTLIVQDVAFDPKTYFPAQYIRDRSIVRIAYTGDDYGWPVYSIAIARGCIDGETVPEDNCASRLRARMVRAPGVLDANRPRVAGAQLVARVTETGAGSVDEVRQVLGSMGLEWVEADIRTCPGAFAVFARSVEAAWVPDAIANPTPENSVPAIVLHPDIIRVEFQQYAQLTTYRGWIAQQSPAAWAVELAAALEPCWGPSAIQPPWSGPG